MQCPICERGCVLGQGQARDCELYREENGKIREIHPDHHLATCPLSIETMPVLHSYPAGKFLHISTAGCNFDGPGCISTVIVRETRQHSQVLRHPPPDKVVKMAPTEDCQSLVFLMNTSPASPPIFFRVGCAGNGHLPEQALEQLIPILNFATIGVKKLSDDAYRVRMGRNSTPVLRTTRRLHEAGVHLEGTCILRRANQAELRKLAEVVTKISPLIPLLGMRFIPLEGVNIRLEPTIRNAEAFCAGLRATAHQERRFKGDYPLTRTLETIEAMRPSLGVDNTAELAPTRKATLLGNGPRLLHDDLKSSPQPGKWDAWIPPRAADSRFPICQSHWPLTAKTCLARIARHGPVGRPQCLLQGGDRPYRLYTPI